MKGVDPELPAPTSAQHVANIGAAAVAAGLFEARLGARAPVSLPLEVGMAACGLPQLVNRETGERLGICVSQTVARKTKGFFV